MNIKDYNDLMSHIKWSSQDKELLALIKLKSLDNFSVTEMKVVALKFAAIAEASLRILESHPPQNDEAATELHNKLRALIDESKQ